MTLYSRLADKSFSSLSSDSINTRRNTTYEKSCKNIKRDPTVRSKVFGPFDSLLKLGRPELLVTE
jgi:hypothetical protein